MSYKIRIINPINDKEWDEKILHYGEYSFFHTREWARILSDTYGFNPVYFGIFNNNEIPSFIPAMLVNSVLTGKRIVSIPFSDCVDPLIEKNVNTEELIKEVISYAQIEKVKFIEFRSTKKNFPFDTKLFRTDYRHVLRLDRSKEELFKLFSDNTKRNIKKSNKNELVLKILNNTAGIKTFYDMMCVTRKKHGLPPQPFAFFLSILSNIIIPGFGDILLAEKGGKYIAGAIYLKIGKKLLYKYGASYADYHELRGNHFVMWEAIKKYTDEGFEEFDFGRTEMENEGLRRFKLSWNTEETFIYTTRYNPNTKSFLPAGTKTRGFHNIIFNHSPVLISRIIGKAIYKHIG